MNALEIQYLLERYPDHPHAKKWRRRLNADILTGRRNGQYYENGKARQSGPVNEVTQYIRYIPQPVTFEEVYAIHGVGETGTLPYQDRHAAVQPFLCERRITYDPDGRQMGRSTELIIEKVQ